MAPSGIILEPNEKVILATRPLFLWEPLVIVDILLLVLALYFTPIQPALMVLFLAVFALLTLWLLVQWIPWSAKWFVLTDRRIITRRGVLNRKDVLAWKRPGWPIGNSRVAYAKWTESDVDVRIEELLAFFGETAFNWHVGPSSSPSDLVDRLVSHGLVLVARPRMMTISLP